MNKKAIAPLFIILFVVLSLISIYVLLFIPLPAFTKIRTIINYFLIIILWFIIQVGLIYAYFQLGKLAGKGFIVLKTKIINWSLGIRNYIIIHT